MMKDSRVFGGILLIAGTTIGAAMLALPVSTGLAGFWPSVAAFLAAFVLMYWSGCLFLELTLSLPGDVNLISLARTTLGRAGATVAWVGFLLLLYSLLAAYLTGSGPLFAEGLYDAFGWILPDWAYSLPILLLFGPLVLIGLSTVDVVNRFLMIGLVGAFAVMVTLLVPQVDAQLLNYSNSDYVLLSFSVVIVAFGYHIIIPSMTSYLGRDVKKVKQCIFWGSMLPLLAYLVWELVILGCIPVSGENGLAFLSVHHVSMSKSLEALLQSSTIANAARAFALFAIVTSFIGVAQSLFDFLMDGLKLPKNHVSRVLVWLLTFVPPLLFVMIFKKGFVAVLEYAGVFVAILIGILPIMMVYAARYTNRLRSPYRAVGGKPLLFLGLLIYSAVVVLVLASNLGWLVQDVSQLI